VGATGKPLTSVVSIGIGGSALGPLFVHTALATEPEAAAQAAGRRLVFLANVDPVDAVRALAGLDPETTLVVVVRCGAQRAGMGGGRGLAGAHFI
jgi:glucose-6-phosphate isomerase